MTPEQEQFDANMNLLLAIQFEGMDPIARQNLTESMEDIRQEYDLAVKKGATSKYYKDLGESIAKSLPNIVKGALSASDAFKKGDYITGSAAMMDLCASVIPVLASLFSATGPEGALVGALFSVIGQILAFFAPKQPSLEEKIQKMLDHLQSEEQIKDMRAVGHSIASYTSNLRGKCMGDYEYKVQVLEGTVTLTANSATVTGTGTTFTRATEEGQWLAFDFDTSHKAYKIEKIDNDTSLTLSSPYTGVPTASTAVKLLLRTIIQRSIAEILEMPLKTTEQASNFLVEMKALKLGLMQGQQKLDVPVFATWGVAGYLEREENQGKEGWPEVLGTWCRTYTDLLTAHMMLNCLADPKEIDTRLKETAEDNKESPLLPLTRIDCWRALNNLKALAKELRSAWQSDNKEALKIVNALTPAARERGLYVHIGTGGYLYAATGPKVTLDWKYLKGMNWDSKRFAVIAPKEDVGSLTPQYHVFLCKHQVEHLRLDAVTMNVSGGSLLLGERVSDVWALPAPNNIPINPNDPKALCVYVGDDYASGGRVRLFELDGKDKSTYGNWSPGTKARVVNVRAVTHPPTTLLDDPDKDGIPPGSPLLGGVNHYNSIHYGALASSPDIYVNAFNDPRYVPSPWPTYSGIDVDPYYLWVFSPEGFACATHASVISCLQGNRKAPRWIGYGFASIRRDQTIDGGLLGDVSRHAGNYWLVGGQETKDYPPLKGLISLSPCEDGTLSAIIYTRSVFRDDTGFQGHFVFEATDTVGLYTTVYSINLKAPTPTIAIEPWIKRGGEAFQIQKMPIPCWSLLGSLKANLQSEELSRGAGA